MYNVEVFISVLIFKYSEIEKNRMDKCMHQIIMIMLAMKKKMKMNYKKNKRYIWENDRGEMS